MPTEEETKMFLNMKHLFIGRKIYNELGYEDFEKYASMNYPELLKMEEFKPCESANGQCSLFCEQNCL